MYSGQMREYYFLILFFSNCSYFLLILEVTANCAILQLKKLFNSRRQIFSKSFVVLSLPRAKPVPPKSVGIVIL